MLKVTFYSSSSIDHSLLEYAVIISRYQNKWIFCKHRDRTTYEFPGGHREPGEIITETAQRELWEETGAISSIITPVSIYSVTQEATDSTTAITNYGGLFYANVTELGPIPPSEMESILLTDQDHFPQHWTYPEIQPYLFRHIQTFLGTHTEIEI